MSAHSSAGNQSARGCQSADNKLDGTSSSQEASDGANNDNPGSSSSTLNMSLKLANDNSKASVIQYLGPGSSYCGYCKRSERQSGGGRRSYDMQTYSLRVSDYQVLLDRNWRRSGTFSYCPINQTTCCPNYPVICTATKFHLTRSQRKCIAKVNSYLATGNVGNNINLDFSRDPTKDKEIQKKKITTLDEIRSSSKLRAKRFLRQCERKAKLYGKTEEESMNDIRDKWDNRLPSRLPLESYLFPKKVMLLGESGSFKAKHSLRIDMVHVNSRRCRASREEQHHMLVRYQNKVHKEDRREWSMSRFCDFLVETPLITEPLTEFDYVSRGGARGGGTPSGDDDDDDCLSFHSNLTDPAEYLLVRPPQLPTAFGTYHCNYYLDDKLIATGVLDVLPKCITTVYFFYDPDYDFLNLGIYSALIEISMIRQMDKHYISSSSNSDNSENQLVNYYLGFYVHECKKMHYKTRFRPSYLLCSKTYCYVPIEICLKKLLDRKYADFADEQHEQQAYGDNSRSLSSSSLSEWFSIPIIPPEPELGSTMSTYFTWLASNLGDEYLDLFLNGYLATYAKLVGPTLLSRLTMKVAVVHRTLMERHKRLTRPGEPTKVVTQ
uniref:Arginyl-tRNA--protein transferase 1 n=1 Tax=Aceria tosichella TaxID=561515 RepID=A0A6G1SG75_9ACAR